MALPVRRTNEVQSWNPFREFDDLHERFNRLMESSFGGSPLGTWMPAVDLEETEESFVVEAELPGVKREDVTVELGENQLHVHGELKEKERKGVLHRQTRRTGQFDYRVTLPGQVDADQVEASLQEGVLRIQVPKAAQAKPRRIQISS